MTVASEKISQNADVIILGGGISGLTTAIVLQSLGMQVTILAEKLPNAAAPRDPKVPTSYAMASAYPHNLLVKNLELISDDSQIVFEILSKTNNSGVEIHEIFEVYEDEQPAPILGSRRMNYQDFDGTPKSLADTINPPHRTGAQYLWGWKFDTYFADMPKYLGFLWNLFEENGGTIKEITVTAQLIESHKGRVILNCLGAGAIEFCSDESPNKILRGRQILLPAREKLVGKRGLPLAYNYTPTEEIFPRGDGNPEYLHLFCREDGWLFGQTREPGYFDQSGNWQGITSPVPTVEVDEISIPKPIFDLNQDILQNWLAVDVDWNAMQAREGYRYYRDPADTGVRLESEIQNDNFVVHNYGHGGSGVTMSWGCALEASRMICQHLKPKVLRGKSQLDRVLQSSMACKL